MSITRTMPIPHAPDHEVGRHSAAIADRDTLDAAARATPPEDGDAVPAWYSTAKFAAEFALAVVMLVPALPLMVLAIVLVKLSSRGPAIYAQRRVGRGGRVFVLYKIRTMRHDCEKLTGPKWATARDPRVTSVGRFLRRTHLDELPQLFNILRGDMGLIGPRPERPEFVTQLGRAIPHYRDRLAIRPGLTGLAQVQLPPDSDLEGVRRKLACDLHYVRWCGPWLDARIVLATGLKVLGVPLATCCRLCRLPSGQTVEVTYSRWDDHAPALARMRTA